MKRETWKMWTWCALVLSIATVGANVFMAFYPNQKDTTTILTPDKIDKLCAEKGWFHISDSTIEDHRVKYRNFYLTETPKQRSELCLWRVCKYIDKWKGVIFVQDDSYKKNESIFVIETDCPDNAFVFGRIYVFGDARMVAIFREFLSK